MKPISIKDFKGNFFKILAETPLSQIGVMTITPGSDSGPEEVHNGDQIVYVIEGEAKVEIDSEKFALDAGAIITVPAKIRHHIYNSGKSDLFFLTIYTPPAY